MLTCKTPWKSCDSWTKRVREKGSFIDNCCSHSAAHRFSFKFLKIKKNCLKLLKNYWKKIFKCSTRSYSSVSGEIQEWLLSLVVRLNWLNEFCQRNLSADDFFIAWISLNDLAEQERLPSLRYVSKQEWQSSTTNRYRARLPRNKYWSQGGKYDLKPVKGLLTKKHLMNSTVQVYAHGKKNSFRSQQQKENDKFLPW